MALAVIGKTKVISTVLCQLKPREPVLIYPETHGSLSKKKIIQFLYSITPKAKGSWVLWCMTCKLLYLLLRGLERIKALL